MTEDPWWTLIVREQQNPNAEVLFAHGASGVETCPDKVIITLQKSDEGLAEYISLIERYGYSFVSKEALPEENWVQRCEELWTPLSIGNLKIVPVLDEDNSSTPDPSDDVILLIPGTGFGTGHHPTTHLALELMQEVIVRAQDPENILDFGTGSAILAIAAVRLFDAHVDAIDIDPLSIENAERNVRLNAVGHAVSLQTGEISDSAGCYPLILANIYAEVLCTHERDIAERCTPGGLLIISGILEQRREVLLECFNTGWEMLDNKTSGEWNAYLLKRRES